MKKSVFAIFLVALMSLPCAALEISDTVEELEELPGVYVDEEACPDACCSFGEWITTEPAFLYERVQSGAVLTRVETCERVEGRGSEVHTTPVAVEVIREHTDAKGHRFGTGDTFHLLRSLPALGTVGWSDGIAFELDPDGIMTAEACAAAPETCWAIQEAGLESVWWVKVVTRSGIVGWSEETERFDGSNTCVEPRAECSQ